MNPARLVAMAAVRAGVAVCQRVRGGLVGTAEKADKSPVTVADFASQALICKMVREAFADDPIVAEEDSAELRGEGIGFVLRQVGASLGREVSEVEVRGWIDLGQEVQEKAGLGLGRYWTVDPIDGTKGFLRGGQYAVALALVEAGRVVLGVLGCPSLAGGVMLVAERDKGVVEYAIGNPVGEGCRGVGVGIGGGTMYDECGRTESRSVPLSAPPFLPRAFPCSFPALSPGLLLW